MTTRLLCAVLLASGVTACTTTGLTSKPQPRAPLWSASYNVPYTAMANCLAERPTGGFTGVPRIQADAGTATVTLALSDGTEMAINYIIRRTGSGTSVVEWRRVLTVGGWEPIDSEAHAHADTCGKV
ncbi:MAG: hypothetical protein Q8K93_24630 [Reyranella sp.]|uniref:hypothetical protein n=1 Tax=Reyranella sp. TaxID=1929291 RepID=UPI0027302ABF|nr:hypothetical protein [Reyranella sp.]MDP1965384.1 hypothetical protein [Reyranella sp.]MDP2378100.1 hypothetical protein [Reyranella sp.]